MSEALALRESPSFEPFKRVAITYAFQLDNGRDENGLPACAFRPSHVHRAIFGNDPKLGATETERAKALFEASSSFLDDITTGIPGVNGRPLLMAASSEAPDDPIRELTMRRGTGWPYSYESLSVGLVIDDPARQDLALRFQDHLCLFESGRMFYLLVLTHKAGPHSPFDEYSVLQTQQLAMKKASPDDAEFLRLDWRGESCSLLGFVEQRLARLSAADEGPGNAVRDILRPFGILGAEEALPVPTCDDLCNASVQVEDPPLFRAAMHAYRHYQMSDDDTGRKSQPGWVRDLDKAWRKRNREALRAGAAMHDAAGFAPVETDEAGSNEIASGDEAEEQPRQILAFAGLAQGVADFPRQDASEIHDSTRPASVSLETLFYVHPAFELSVGKNWRTFREAQCEIGACPYALLTWIIAVHDELVVSDMERLIEDMIFGKVEAQDAPASIGKTVPMAELSGLMEKMAMMLLPSRARIIDRSLSARLDVFRWCSIHQSGNVFRYPTERELLGAIREARGTRQRFDDAHDLLDRYENLVEDTSSLAASYSSRFTNWLLAAIALFGIAALPKTAKELLDLVGSEFDPIAVSVVAFLLVVAVFAVWNFWPGQDRRSRKSS